MAQPRSAHKTSTEAALLSLVRELGSEMQWRAAVLEHLSAATSLERDLGLDSLTRMELVARIERRFGVRLDNQSLAKVTTLGELCAAIERAAADTGQQTIKHVSDLSLEETESKPHDCETLVDVLDWHLREHPDRPHIQLFEETGEGETLTFRDLYSGAVAVAAGLQHQGLNHGDSVAIMLPTGKDYFFSFFGVLLAGGVPVSLYPPARVSQLEDHLRRHQGILNNCGASRLIAAEEVKPFARLLKTQVDTLITVNTVAEFSAAAETPGFPRLRGDDIAFLQYTSGSTGTPKGVVLTHANLLANIRVMGETLEADSRDVIVSWLPLYHDMGLIGCWLGSLYYSCLLVVMSPLDFLARPERWLWAIHRYRGTVSPAPNFAYELCLKRIDDVHVEGLDLSSWRAALNGAEAVSPQTLRRFTERYRNYGFKPQSLMPVYGLAENSVGLAFPPLNRGPLIDRVLRDTFARTGRAEPAPEGDLKALEFVACGRPLREHEIRIVDEAGRELPERREGQLQFRGPSATAGYFRDPAQTAKLFNGDWLNSGDRAYSANGDIYITGRSKDIIIHGGRNLYPEELEAAVGDIEGIRKGCVAVFGATDAQSGTEKLVVQAETRSTDSRVRKALHEAVRQCAIDIIGMAPDDVVLVPPHTVLKTSSGKVRRSASREAYENGIIGARRHGPALQLAHLLLSSVVPGLRRARRSGFEYAYAAWFWLIAGLFAPWIWLSVVCTPGAQRRWPLIRFWGRVFTVCTGIRLQLHGEEHLLPTGTTCVFVANHTSYLDFFVLITAIPRRFAIVAKAELRRFWPIRILLDRADVEYVERFDRQQSVADAHKLVEQARSGKSLLFFPEGTFTRVNGIYPFHMGAFITAVEASVPVMPMAVRGTGTIMRPETWFPRHGSVTITIDHPLLPGGAQSEQSVWEQAVALREQARTSILQNSGAPDLKENPPLWQNTDRGSQDSA